MDDLYSLAQQLTALLEARHRPANRFLKSWTQLQPQPTLGLGGLAIGGYLQSGLMQSLADPPTFEQPSPNELTVSALNARSVETCLYTFLPREVRTSAVEVSVAQTAEGPRTTIRIEQRVENTNEPAVIEHFEETSAVRFSWGRRRW
jgi:hypothetical protein